MIFTNSQSLGTLVTSCFLFNFSTILFNQLPKEVILCMSSFILFHLIRGTISLVSKKWYRISEDPSIVGKAISENFESIPLHECLTFMQLKNVIERVIWVRTAKTEVHYLRGF